MRVNDRIPEHIQRGTKRRFTAFIVLGAGHGHMAGQIKPITYATTIRKNAFFDPVFDNDTRPGRVIELRMHLRESDKGTRFLREMFEEEYEDQAEALEMHAEYERWFNMSAAGQATEPDPTATDPNHVKQVLFPEDMLPKAVLDLRTGRKSTGKYVPPKKKSKKGSRASSGEASA